jgi:hypothetical protein
MNKKLALYSLIGLLAAGGTIAFSFARNPQDISTMQPAIADIGSHSGHSTDGMPEMSHSNKKGDHQGHSMDKNESHQDETTQAKLTLASTPSLNTPVTFVIDVQDSKGKAIAQFDTFQEKLMHLIVVSDDLQVFQHLHPTHKGNGRFEVKTALPQTGGYTLVSDYKPVGQKEAVSVLQVRVPGTPASAPTVDLKREKSVETTNFVLSLSEPAVKVGQEVMLTFDLKDAATNQAISDLKPYLGEEGHLVILKQSTPLTRADYIHAHAMKGAPDGKVEFMTTFPKPGKYKLWGQFNRNGKIVVADFWVDVL